MSAALRQDDPWVVVHQDDSGAEAHVWAHAGAAARVATAAAEEVRAAAQEAVQHMHEIASQIVPAIEQAHQAAAEARKGADDVRGLLEMHREMMGAMTKMATGFDKVVAAMTTAAAAPRRVVRDKDGRVTGLEVGRG